jgi:tetratricopeptide (TPR) repeat protein
MGVVYKADVKLHRFVALKFLSDALPADSQTLSRTSEREKFDIESMYHSDVTGDLESTVRVFREWLGSYPRDAVALGNLANTYADLGRYQQAAELDRESLQQNHNDVVAYINLAFVQMALDQFPEARKTIQDGFDRKLEAESLHYLLYSLAFVNGDERRMAEQVTWSEGRPEATEISLLMQSSKEAYYGHLQKARELNRRAAASGEGSGRKESAAWVRTKQALREAAVGNLAEARRRAIATAEEPVVGPIAEADRALIFAWVGDTARAESIIDGLAKESPRGTIVQSVIVPTVRAEVELSKKNPERSIELLRAVEPYELTYAAFEDCLYAAYIRGQSYLAANQGAAAALEFQKILAHRGLVKACETGPLARLGLGRAYAMQGDAAKAKASYQDLFALWKDADLDIPILKQAKAEYARCSSCPRTCAQ